MEKFILKLLTTMTLLSLAACGSGTSTDVTGLDSYVQAGTTSFSQADSDTLSGIGSVRFVSTLNGILSNNSIALKTQLDGSITASTTVIMNSNDLLVTDSSGIAIKFYRNGINVYVTIGVNGTWTAAQSSTTSIYAPLAIDVIIDVHNNTGGSNKTRVLIWRRTMTPYAATTADIDTNSSSDLSGTYPASSQAPGIFAGLRLDNSTVTAASISTAKTLD